MHTCYLQPSAGQLHRSPAIPLIEFIKHPHSPFTGVVRSFQWFQIELTLSQACAV
ncbi:hypothetical protein [Simplicispira suum]|uniref:hypothetical protein n=1 Tax=Simplicispira suum TaxID=2109915 RepID=UPI001FE38D41|nr:hypothetical protein [Simplicispira suum]